jgi:hypothetical protein
VGAALLAASLWPIPYLAAPRWDVTVRTANGQALPGVSVRLVYQDYSAEDRSHELTVVADRDGRARFAPQRDSASLLRRLYFTIYSARTGIHASFGRHAYVFALGGGYEGSPTDGQFVTSWSGDPDVMESVIVAKPVPSQP